MRKKTRQKTNSANSMYKEKEKELSKWKKIEGKTKRIKLNEKKNI